LILLGARQRLAVVGTDDRGVEGAFELLRVLVLAEIALGERELACGNEAGLACLEHEGKPVLFRLRAPPQLEEGIAALGRADEDRPDLPCGPRRPAAHSGQTLRPGCDE